MAGATVEIREYRCPEIGPDEPLGEIAKKLVARFGGRVIERFVEAGTAADVAPRR